MTLAKNNDSFVDDTDAMASKLGATYYLSEKLTVQHLERGAQVWADLIRASGGSIALHKCLWQILCWRDQTFPPELKLLSSHDITLDDGRSAKSQIKQNDANTPNHGLGCSHAPSGTQEPEFDHRLAQCRDVIGRVATKKINARYAHHLLHGRVIPKTTYSMATTSFSADQCRQMNTVVDEVMLPKLRFNRHMAKAVLYAPQSRGGAAYPSFQVIQDQKGILTMLQHFRWNGTVGKDVPPARGRCVTNAGMVEARGGNDEQDEEGKFLPVIRSGNDDRRAHKRARRYHSRPSPHRRLASRD
ncbi:hypothetical protein ACHAWF_001011 [Thalassiosira exigua]